MRYLSVCSGIEAASVAWQPLGWSPVAFSEIERFPRSVLKYRFPEVPLHGDFTTIGNDDYGPIDLLVGGTPCQSFSIAGLRGGMDDDRGNLALQFLRLADRKKPRWIVWENVPGILSSFTGPEPPSDLAEGQRWDSVENSDFGSFLAGMAECGYGFAYRILDAQFVRVESHEFAVPQRRRRVFVVGYLGDWRPPAAVLFERQSVCGHPSPRRESRKDVAGTISSRTTGGGGLGTDFELDGGLVPSVARTLTSRQDGSPNIDSGPPEVVVGALQAGDGEKWGSNQFVDQGKLVSGHVFALQSNVVDPNISNGPGGKGYSADGSAYTIEARRPQLVAFSSKDDGGDASDVSPTLRSMNNSSSHANAGGQVAVACFDSTQITSPQNRSTPGSVCHTVSSHQHPPAIASQRFVRRLTPRECERLQGFPDDWTKVPHRGKQPEDCPDGPRYKAIGNSMAVNCMSWLGQRIDQVTKQIGNEMKTKRDATPAETTAELLKNCERWNSMNPGAEHDLTYWIVKQEEAVTEGYKSEVCSCGTVFLAFHHFCGCRCEECPMSDGVTLADRMLGDEKNENADRQ